MNRKLTIPGSALLVAAALVVALFAGCVNANVNTMLGLLNKDRAAVGRPAFKLDDQLDAKAQAWADHLAAAGSLSHSTLTSGVTGCYRALGENVAQNTSLAKVEKVWIDDVGINPPIHRNNIRSTAFDHVGIGVTVKNGVYWVVVDFKDAC